MRADGSAQRRLTRGNDPSWSPDGRRIALSVYRNRSGSRIWVIDADGRDLRRLTTAEHPYDTHSSPVWSPDGKTIAFQGYDDGNYWIDVVGADGGGQRQLTPKAGPYWDTDPVWSRDGRTIMFSTPRQPRLRREAGWERPTRRGKSRGETANLGCRLVARPPAVHRPHRRRSVGAERRRHASRDALRRPRRQAREMERHRVVARRHGRSPSPSGRAGGRARRRTPRSTSSTATEASRAS